MSEYYTGLTPQEEYAVEQMRANNAPMVPPAPAPNTPAIAPESLMARSDVPPAPTDVERVAYAYAPLKALVESRGVTLHAAVGKARGMRAAMLARRNTKGVRTSTVRGAGTAQEPTTSHSGASV